MTQARSRRLSWVIGLLGVVGAAVCPAEEPVSRSCHVQFGFELQEVSEGATPGVRGALRLRPSDDEMWETVKIENGVAESRLDVGKSWVLEVEAEGFWGPTQVLNIAEDCERKSHKVPLWKVGRLAGKVSVDGRTDKLPEELTARLRSVQRPGAARAIGRVRCAVDQEKSTWSCELPSGSLDLVFSSTELAPIYRRNVAVKTGKARQIDVLRFRTGASVAGYVEVEDGEISKKCKARITPMSVGAGQGGAIRSKTKSVAVDEKGFFQLVGLPSGAYALEVDQPGFAVQKVFPLDLFEGRETFLKESVVLRRPIDIEISVSPPVDWLESPWRVTLLRASSQSAQFEDTPVFEGTTDQMGQASVPGQSPGRYSLTILDSDRNPFHSELLLQVRDASEAHLHVELDLVVIEGEVSFGERPVSGELYFGGSYGARSVRLPVDSEGAFQGVLPAEGLWEVDVRGQNPEITTTVEVEVEVGPGGRALFDIELPDTQVFGRVVNHGGGVVEGARVTLSTELGSISTESNAEGEFELLAVPDEIGWLSAKHSTLAGRLTSKSVALSVVEGQPTGPVVLRLVKNRSIQGIVMGPQGPVAGAQVQVRPADSSLPVSTKVRSEMDGTFTAEIPEAARRLAAVVSAPGHALKAFEIDVPDGQVDPIQLQVPAQGGTLEVFVAGEEGWRLDVLQDGRLLAFQSLYEWTMAHGGNLGQDENEIVKMVIPQLAAGDYRVCFRPSRAENYGAPTDPPIEILERLRDQGTCFSGYLGASSQVSYRFDAKE